MPEKKKNFKRPLEETVILAMLAALYVVLNRFVSISAWNVNYSFAFVATVFASCMFGIHGGAIVGGLGDLVGAILFPKGTYFPGFTLSAMIIGAIYGYAFKHVIPSIKKKTPVFDVLSISVAAVVSQLISSLLLNSLWISILYNPTFKATFISRIPQFAVMTVLQIVISPIIYTLSKKVEKALRNVKF